MITSDRINALLEKVGSPYRAMPGSLIDEAMMRFLEAIPAYLEKIVDEVVEKRARTAGQK